MHQRCANKSSDQLTHFAFLIGGKRLKLKLYKCVCYQQIAVPTAHSHDKPRFIRICRGVLRAFSTVDNFDQVLPLNYRPQQKLREGNISQACVKNSVHREGVSQNAMADNPPPQKQTLLGRHPLGCIPECNGRHPQQILPRQTPPTPPGRHPLPWADTPSPGQTPS